MTVMIPVYVQIELDEVTAESPSHGSILETRLLASVDDAVRHAMQQQDTTGFEHGLNRVAHIRFVGTDTPRRMDAVDTSVLTVTPS